LISSASGLKTYTRTATLDDKLANLISGTVPATASILSRSVPVAVGVPYECNAIAAS
ncbi:hypothetical protein Ancab_039126, partial [Ancistrocladus abbreviatus]